VGREQLGHRRAAHRVGPPRGPRPRPAILAGKPSPGRKIGADVGDIRGRIVEAFPQVRRIAEELEATPTQLSLAFTLTHPATANVLFGSSSVAQFQENLGALDLLERAGADRLREAAAGLWLDRHVSADGTWPAT
jgi:aryl-alcohol dehydrogenase-like predicted oxidoreductase